MHTVYVVQKKTIPYLNKTWCETAKPQCSWHWMLWGLNKCFPVWKVQFAWDEQQLIEHTWWKFYHPGEMWEERLSPAYLWMFILPLVADSDLHALSFCLLSCVATTGIISMSIWTNVLKFIICFHLDFN